ncbi:MAG: hypothetical protein AAF675_04540 [Pseudomonadota bacterium]
MRRTDFLAIPLILLATITTPALAQSGLDLPAQIGTPDRSVGSDAILPSATPSDKLRVDSITPEVNQTSAEQTDGGRDLCGPETSDAERRRLGIDCSALTSAPEHTDRGPVVGTSRDPLLTPRDEEARRDFNALGLDDDVPATVILQQ